MIVINIYPRFSTIKFSLFSPIGDFQGMRLGKIGLASSLFLQLISKNWTYCLLWEASEWNIFFHIFSYQIFIKVEIWNRNMCINNHMANSLSDHPEMKLWLNNWVIQYSIWYYNSIFKQFNFIFFSITILKYIMLI